MSKVLVSLEKARTYTQLLPRTLAEGDLARADGPGKDPGVRAALRELDRLFADAPAFDSTAAIRADRDSR